MYLLAVLILLVGVAMLIVLCVSYYQSVIKKNDTQVESIADSIWGTPPTPFDKN